MHIAALSLAADPAKPPVPPAAQPSTHPNVPLIAGGTIVLYVAYGAPLATAVVYGVLVVPFIAAAKSRIPTEPFLLLVPVAGPVLLNQTRSMDGENQLKTLLYVDAAAQAIGVAMLIAGFSMRSPDAADWRPYAGPA